MNAMWVFLAFIAWEDGTREVVPSKTYETQEECAADRLATRDHWRSLGDDRGFKFKLAPCQNWSMAKDKGRGW